MVSLRSGIFTDEEKLPELNVEPAVSIHVVLKYKYSWLYENPAQEIRVEDDSQ